MTVRVVSRSLDLGALSGTGRAALGFSRIALTQSSIAKALFSKRKNEGMGHDESGPWWPRNTHSVKRKLSCQL